MIESNQVLRGLFIGRDQETHTLFSRRIELSRGVDDSGTVRLFTEENKESSVDIPAPAGNDLFAAFSMNPGVTSR
jgi:hypothetical protein